MKSQKDKGYMSYRFKQNGNKTASKCKYFFKPIHVFAALYGVPVTVKSLGPPRFYGRPRAVLLRAAGSAMARGPRSANTAALI